MFYILTGAREPAFATGDDGELLRFRTMGEAMREAKDLESAYYGFAVLQWPLPRTDKPFVRVGKKS